ncbi:hypothetical protein D6C91_03311 [Aureobasidium pullulans]|uniref:Uncharacterized protein n=1 Tax=Aureobasidium pullulans TaxID=5580 RepID=A0A4S9THR2_AURPU|nr:hypothetical protein D6C91_03311 [Aureobasidium pullulans]
MSFANRRRVQGDTNKTKIVFNSSTFGPQQVVHASHPLLDTFAMRALSRIIITGLILATLLWLRGQFFKLHQSILALDRLSQDGGLLSNHVHSNNTNASSTAVEDPFRAVMHAISNTLLNGTIENLATPKSGLRDTRTKVVVVAKTAKEHTQWVARMLPNWKHAIYVTDDRKAPLHTARNKGREANAYLTYIIENYDNLPETIAFIHSHLSSWHNDQNAAKALQLLNIDFVQKNGYANFRCHTTPGCDPAEIQPFRNKKEQARIDKHEAATENAFAQAWTDLFNSTVVPEQIGVACCAQFAVSRDQVLKRPLSHYIWFHSWLMDTSLSDATAGRVMEYLWHIIFGQDPVYCPKVWQCFRNVYDQWDVFS